ncbi:MAG: hypothetical protein WC523_06445 [Patescibacteria group bacterium]
MPKKYKITPLIWCVKDEASTKFHVKNNDYFGTIATVLSLIKQQIKKDGVKNAAALEKTLKNLETDLLFLQKNYQINPKIKNKNMTPKGKLKSQ